MEEEELLRRRMMQPNQLIQPSQVTPDKTCSQVTSTDCHTPDRPATKQLSPQKRPSPTQAVNSNENKRVCKPPAPNPPPIQPVNKLTPRRTTGPPPGIRKHLGWRNQHSRDQAKANVPNKADQIGSRVRNVEIVNPVGSRVRDARVVEPEGKWIKHTPKRSPKREPATPVKPTEERSSSVAGN